MMTVFEMSVGHAFQLQSRTTKKAESSEAVQQVIQQRARSSEYRVASCTVFQRMNTHRHMRHTLHMFPFKIQIQQPFSPNVINECYILPKAIVQLMNDSELDVDNILFSDEVLL